MHRGLRTGLRQQRRTAPPGWRMQRHGSSGDLIFTIYSSKTVENGVPYEQPLARLREYLEGEILLHAKAEERTLYRAAVTQARGSDLVRVLTAEHYALACLAGRLRLPADGPTAATIAEWITTLFAGHVAKENDLLLPALTGSGTDLAALLADMHHAHAEARA